MKIILNILLLFFCNLLIAQNRHGNNWISGAPRTYKINFANNFANVQIYDTTNFCDITDGHSVISDSLGKLILVCNSGDLFDSNHVLIKNGDTLICENHYNFYSGAPVNMQTSIILPIDERYYYVFTCSITDNVWNIIGQFNILYMHKVDMQANGGHGEVIEKKVILTKDSILYSRTGITACRHANGKDWWLVKQGSDTNIIYNFFIGKDTFAGPFANGFKEPHYSTYDRSGQIMFNEQGTKVINVNERPNQVFIADFNRCTGQYSNPKVFNIPALLIDSALSDTMLERLPRGACFSPNGKYAYIILRSKIFQFEFDEPDSFLAWHLVSSIDTTWAYFQQYNTAYLGLDGRIYIGYWNGFGTAWSYITNPDIKGSGCNFCKQCLQFPKNGISNPPNMPNYNLGASADSCWPLSIPIIEKKEIEFLVYPNPTFNNFNIHIESNINFNFNIEIYNAQGILVQAITQKKGIINIAVDASGWPRGVYVVRIGGLSKKVIID
jgi:DNA-binding beta-propeller fold protein YncE